MQTLHTAERPRAQAWGFLGSADYAPIVLDPDDATELTPTGLLKVKGVRVDIRYCEAPPDLRGFEIDRGRWETKRIVCICPTCGDLMWHADQVGVQQPSPHRFPGDSEQCDQGEYHLDCPEGEAGNPSEESLAAIQERPIPDYAWTLFPAALAAEFEATVRYRKELLAQTPHQLFGPVRSGRRWFDQTRPSNDPAATRHSDEHEHDNTSRIVAPSIIAPEFSDEWLALQFVRTYAHKLRYVAAWSKWYEWTGTYWRRDDTIHAFDLARAICRDAAGQCNERSRKKIASAGTVAAVERLARADRALAAVIDQWDSDIWLLNTPAGVFDLKTGDMRTHRQEDYMTRITAAAPGGPCPVWLEFLNRVTGGDDELEAFLQRLAGYALTGSTEEHVLAFLYGTGANGKSVFIDTISGILSDYHRTAPIETFTASNSDRHPTELAMLRGARLVTAVETEEGRRWAESRIKTMTGGDRISARFMRADFFEYTPQFKLLIAGNHRPGLRSVDESIRRRFHLVPFTVTIPPAERDHGLKDKLRLEWPGILQWMIDGCLQWQRDGLSPPEAVRQATGAYLESEDALSNWMAESCERSPNAWSSYADLFASWTAWSETAGEHTGSLKRFVHALETRGLVPKRGTGGVRGFLGVRVLASQRPKSHWSRDD